MELELDADGKPCKVCNSGLSFKNWAKQQKTKQSASAPADESQAKSQSQSQSQPQSQSTTTKLLSPTLADKFGCPVDSDELGRQTWTFLHTAASYYPITASASQQTQMRSLIDSIGVFYPCGDCATHLRQYVKQSPPQVHSRSALELWMCQMHNEVNTRLGKDEFDCDMVPQRWRDGWRDGSCD